MTKDFLRLKTVQNLPQQLRGGVIAIGNFDGVHRGHQAVLQQALDIAKKHHQPALVLTFEPHPRSFFNNTAPVDRLTPAKEKAEIFRLMGFDGVIEQSFDASFCAKTADDFVKTILIHHLSAKTIVTGCDFHFGAKRSGNPQYLIDAGQHLGFDVIQVEPFKDENGTIISSSRIRQLLTNGCVEEAAALLGYHYTINAKVIHGQKLGRTLGFPTANMALPLETGLKHGIYAVKFRRENKDIFNAVASFGSRPTVNDNGIALLETFLFNFNGDLYDENASVSFYAFLRNEEKFNDLNALIQQMNKDLEEAKTVLSKAQSLSPLDFHFTFENAVKDNFQ